MRLDLLALLGIPYLTEGFLAEINAGRQEEAYRVYVTDCFYDICTLMGYRINKRFSDILHPVPVDERDGMEIAMERLERFGVKVVG